MQVLQVLRCLGDYEKARAAGARQSAREEGNVSEEVEATEACSFCKRPKADVAHLVGKPGGAQICDDCARQAKKLAQKAAGVIPFTLSTKLRNQGLGWG